jgi:hypothetical protein
LYSRLRGSYNSSLERRTVEEEIEDQKARESSLQRFQDFKDRIKADLVKINGGVPPTST